MNFIPRFFSPPRQSFFLFGPRGTGKSTLLKNIYKNGYWIDLLKPEILRNFLSRPENLVDIVHSLPNGHAIIIDEIQKAPLLLSLIHLLIEEKKEWQFILTGSSSRKLKRTGADLLGGRAAKCVLHPFIASELKSIFSLENSLKVGNLPLLLDSRNSRVTLEGYISLYLQEEIQAEGLVRNIENFSRFLEIISFSHASIINVTNISRECAIKRKTVENYILILEELLLGFQLQVFRKKAQRELSAHPKFYLFDTGVYRILRPTGPFDKVSEIEGAALEGLVAQHLMAWKDYTMQPHDIFFWRTRSGLEVDFVVYGEFGIWAIEVKNGLNIHPQDIKPLEAFLMDYPMAKAILVYRGQEPMFIKGIHCIPCDKFLQNLIPNQPIPANFL